MTTTSIIAPEAPAYITISEAADALASRPWPVVRLIEDGELRAVRFGSLVLVSAYDVEQLGGEVGGTIPQWQLEQLVDAAMGKGATA